MVDVCDGKVFISVGELYNWDCEMGIVTISVGKELGGFTSCTPLGCEMGIVTISVGKELGGFTSCTPLGLLKDNVVGNIVSYTWP